MYVLKMILSIVFSVLVLAQTYGQEDEPEFIGSLGDPVYYKSPKEVQLLEGALMDGKIKLNLFEKLVALDFDSIQIHLSSLQEIIKKENLQGKLLSNGLHTHNQIGYMGTIGFVPTDKESGSSYFLKYWYEKDSIRQYKIKVLSIYKDEERLVEYPELYTSTTGQLKIYKQIQKSKDNKERIKFFKSFIANLEKAKTHKLLPYRSRPSGLANRYGMLSWFYVLEGLGKEALPYAERGYQLSEGRYKWILSNEILSYILMGETEKWLEMYSEMKNVTYRGTTIREMLIYDIKLIEKRGKTIPNEDLVKETIEFK